MNTKEKKDFGFSRKKIVVFGVILVCVLVFAMSGSVWAINASAILESVIFEAGEDITAQAFSQNNKKISFAPDSQKPDTSIPGEYEVKLKSGPFTYKATAIVKDTIAPKADAVTVYYNEGDELTAEQFVENIEDATKTTVKFVKEPDTKILDNQDVEVEIEDAGNNTTIIESKLIIRMTHTELELEAGEEFPDIEQFLKIKGQTASFVSDVSKIDTKKIGEHEIKIKVNDTVYRTELKIKDTVAPVLEVKDVTIFDIDTLEIQEFISLAEDITNITYSYEQQPDTTKAGEYTVTIKAVDEGKNETNKQAKLTVLHDTEAPVILGVKNFTAFIGDAVDFEDGISVSDNHDKNVELKIDTGSVNLNKEGKYKIIYSAVDTMGNETVLEAVFTLIKDTEAPVISGVRDIGCFIGDTPDLRAGITVTDNRDKSLDFKVDASNVNFAAEGIYPIVYTAVDTAGNKRTETADVYVMHDTEAPVISGVHDITAYVGEDINYKSGISVTDNRDGNITVAVDASAVNNMVAGTYIVVYTATDSSGNTATATANVTITPQPEFPYEIRVNKQANVVNIYARDENGEYTIPYTAFLCSCGGENTPEGTFKTPAKYRWHTLKGGVWGQYCTRVVGGILFHSVPYKEKDNSTLYASKYNKLGTTASAGCIRLTVEAAKWIYDNCPIGMTVVVYSSSDPGPFGKPTAAKLPSDCGWDPTDPDPANPWNQ